MGRYVYCGSQGDETFSGYTYEEHYKNADTGVEIKITSSEENMNFLMHNEIITWEEYFKISDERKYGQRIDNDLAVCLQNRNWKVLVEKYGLNIEELLSKCVLIWDTGDYILTNGYGAFPSRIFEVVKILSEVMDKINNEDCRNLLKSIIEYLKLKGELIFIDWACEDLEESKYTEILYKIRHLNKYDENQRKKIIDMLVQFDAREKNIISFDTMRELQSSTLLDRTLISFYDYYDFGKLTRKEERIYPLYCGKSLLECLVFESFQYQHYVKWQNERLATKVIDAVVSPRTIELLNSICNNDLFFDLLNIIENINVDNLELKDSKISVPSKRLILRDSFVQIGSDSKLTFK